MASSLFGNPNSKPMAQTPNNGFASMLEQFNQFKTSMTGKDPKAFVQELLSSGKMTRQQFEQFGAMATQLQQLFK